MEGVPGATSNTSSKGKIYTHLNPHPDEIACIWWAKKTMAWVREAEIIYVHSRNPLPPLNGDAQVLCFGVGGGQYDHHGKQLERTCSLAMFVERMGVAGDPGLKPIVELITKLDNAERVSATDVGRILQGFPGRLRNPDSSVDWPTIMTRHFEIYDIIYFQETRRVHDQAELNKFASWKRLKNGIMVGTLFGRPDLSAVAFESGIPDVVIWTQRFGAGKGFYVGIQMNRLSLVKLGKVAAVLRLAEFRKRGREVPIDQLQNPGRHPLDGIDDWYLDDECRFILRGSRSYPIDQNQRTKLTEQEIETLACQALEELSLRNWRVN
ncbi:MAG: chromate resistance protein [bacterium]|nr:chromate resistance protein [bacterium]